MSLPTTLAICPSNFTAILMPPLVELRNVSKRFGGVRALDEVSLDLHAGQVHCLAGENGSGKSTLIKVLAGVHQHDAGTIAIAGQTLDRLTPIESVRHGIQVIYQDFSLFPNLTVLENLSLNSQLEHRIHLINRRRMRQTAEEAMQRLGVKLPLHTTVEQLPIAQKQLVAIARALVQDAKLIILDEPTTALTHLEVDTLFDIIKKLKERGVALLFVSHKLREMQSISDHFTVLRNGRVVAEGPASEFDAAHITESMTGRKIEERRQLPKQVVKPQPTILKAESLTGDVLRNVSFSLHAGQIVGLTGLLGSGQTELALALFGLQPCESGRVTVVGTRDPIRNVQDALDAGIAYVPEDRLTEGLFLEQSIEDNLIAAFMEPVQTAGGLLSTHRVQEHVDHWLTELTVQASHRSDAIKTLSGGNQQRVVLAKWLSREPKVLVLNGPTVGVDIGSKETLHKKLRELADNGLAVLMISDDLRELATHCDRVLVMHRGQIASELSSGELTEDALSQSLNNFE